MAILWGSAGVVLTLYVLYLAVDVLISYGYGRRPTLTEWLRLGLSVALCVACWRQAWLRRGRGDRGR